MDRKQVIMKNLNCSEEEALQIIEMDKAIDRDEPMPFDLPKDKEKIGKKMCNVDTHQRKETVYKFDKKPRKENTIKRNIITDLYNFFIIEGYKNLEIINTERIIGFSVGDKNYTITLTEKRK